MPTYDYLCPENGLIVEASHRMSDSISTWGELCERTGTDLASTPEDSPVKKQIGAPAVNTPKVGEWKHNPARKKQAALHNHGPGCGCC